MDKRFIRKDGSIVYTSISVRCIRKADGTADYFLILIEDITPRVKVEQSLRDSESYFKTLSASAPVGIFKLDTQFQCVFTNTHWTYLTGQSLKLSMGAGWHDVFSEENRLEIMKSLYSEISAGNAFEYECELEHNKWVHLNVVGLRDDDGQLTGYLGTMVDISDHKMNIERQMRMMKELDHRVKNNLSSVISLANMTIAKSENLEEFSESFTGRVHALSRTHEYLNSQNWDGIEIHQILIQTLESFVGQVENRVKYHGEVVMLRSQVSSSLSLVIHELATNAIKHGAISNINGEIQIEWSVHNDNELVLRWTERGGPKVEEFAEEGLGVNIMRGLVEYELRGNFDINFQYDGIECKIKIPDAIALESDELSIS